SAELQGFELIGDFATVLDGAGAAGEGKQFVAIHFSHDDILHVVNPGSAAGTVRITLNDAMGGVLGSKSVALNPFQPATVKMSELSDDGNIGMISITSDVAVSVSVTTKLPGGRDLGVTNAVPMSTVQWELYFPFSPNGPQGSSSWKTFIGIANLAAQS